MSLKIEAGNRILEEFRREYPKGCNLSKEAFISKKISELDIGDELKCQLYCLSTKTPLYTAYFEDLKSDIQPSKIAWILDFFSDWVYGKEVFFQARQQFVSNVLQYNLFHKLGSELHDNLSQKDIDGFNKLLEKLPEASQSDLMKIADKFNGTLLHIAVRRITTRGFDLAENFLNKMDPKDLGIQDYDGSTPLHIALENRFIYFPPFKSLAEKILNKMDPKDLSIQDSAGAIPLNIALEKGYKDLAEKILNKMDPKDLGILKSYGRTPLHLAIAKGFVDLAENILNKMDSKDLSIQDSAGEIPLNLALEKDFEGLAEKIINKMMSETNFRIAYIKGEFVLLSMVMQFKSIRLANEIIKKIQKDDLINKDDSFLIENAVLIALHLSEDLTEKIIDILPRKYLVNKFLKVFYTIILHGSENLAIKALEKIDPEDLTIKYRYPCELFSDKELPLYIAIDKNLKNLAYKIHDKMPKESCYPSDLKRCLKLAKEKGLDELTEKIVKKTS